VKSLGSALSLLWFAGLVVEIHAYSDGANLVDNATVFRREREHEWI
jgi:hypothetical protein